VDPEYEFYYLDYLFYLLYSTLLWQSYPRYCYYTQRNFAAVRQMAPQKARILGGGMRSAQCLVIPFAYVYYADELILLTPGKYSIETLGVL